MAATRRLTKELADLVKQDHAFLQSIEVRDSSVLHWKGVILPMAEPFNKGAFKIELTFPTEYPFKPPLLCFITPIYHPNVDEKGQVCLPIINAANWKPATKMEQGMSLIDIEMACTHQSLSPS